MEAAIAESGEDVGLGLHGVVDHPVGYPVQSWGEWSLASSDCPLYFLCDY